MRSPFCILTVLGDLLDDGEVRFVEAVQTLEIARQRIEALAELAPGQYVIYNEETGERFSVIAGGHTEHSALGPEVNCRKSSLFPTP